MQIMVYFMELATPHTEEAIKLVDKVGGFEQFIQKYEIDGATALKLDLSLDTPIIIVPRNSISREYVDTTIVLLYVILSDELAIRLNWVRKLEIT